MNLSEVFIRRPIATSLLMAGIALFGFVSYRALPVSDMPSVEFPTINVGVGLPGGDPGTMSSAVASPMERQFTTIAGLDEMTSSSTTGSAYVTLQFGLDRNIDSAAVDVQTAIAAVIPLLPAGLPAPPSFRKYNPASQPIIFLVLESDTVPMSALDDYAENLVAPRVSMVSGVSQAQVFGQQKFAVRVQVDPEKLRAEGIGLDAINQALTNWNVNLPTGQLFGRLSTFNIHTNGMLMNASAFRPMVLAYKNGAPIRLEQVANVIDDVQDNKQASWLYSKQNGTLKRAIFLGVTRQPGTNTIEVADKIRALEPYFESFLPPSVHLVLRGDQSKTIRAAFRDIQITMLVTLVLVVGVIYLFLHNGSATLIPALALPFSILGTFAVMEVMQFTLDNLSMMALILSIGFIVDDAIVMLENIVRHMEAGEGPLEAALKGSHEIGFTILSMTISLAAVFIPILFMSGVLGRIFREFAVTITTAILISGLVSVTLTPMLCSRFLRAAALHGKSGLAGVMERTFEAMLHGYDRSLQFVLRHRLVMVGVFVAVLVATVHMFGLVPKGFIPDTDNDQFNINMRAAQGTSYYEMVRNGLSVADVVRKNPNVESFMLSTGGGGVASMNTAGIFVNLAPRARRAQSAELIANDIRDQLAHFTNFRAFTTLPSSLQIGGFAGNSAYNFTVQSANSDELYAWGPRLQQAIMTVPEVTDVDSNMEVKSPRVYLVLDRDKAAAVGLNASNVETALYDGLGPQWSSTIYGTTNQYQVLMELDPKYQERVDALRRVAFRAANGSMVPLESVMKFKESVGPQRINHSGQLESVTISFNVRPGASLGAAVDHIRAVANDLLPATVTTSFLGSAKVFDAATKNLGLLLFVAIGVVYIVLGMLYESYIHPITILSGLPSAGLGALVTLWLFGNQLNVYSFVGLVMLIGIVKKNAIMQIDFALEAERRRGKTPAEAIYEGCLIRFRPIMMTTMAGLLGSIPIALGFGAGGESRRPLGLAVVGGLVVSQFITLYLTPVVYTYLATFVKTRALGPRALSLAVSQSNR